MPARMPERTIRSICVAALLLCLGGGLVAAQEIRFFQIGTGPTGETRFAFGGLIANAISNPPAHASATRAARAGCRAWWR